jgi:hypothetical protein
VTGLATEEEIEIVLTRLEQTMPPNVKLIIGGSGPYSKEELIEHVKEEDDIGELVVQAHMLYLRSFGEKTRFENIKPKISATE